MRHLAGRLPALSCAILCTACAASVIQTQINLAKLADVGALIDAAARLSTTLEDLARFGPVMAGIVAAAFIPAMAAGQVAARSMKPGPRLALLALAGVVGLVAAFRVIALFSPMPALVEATDSAAGLLAVCLAGAPGGALYAYLTGPARAPAKRPMLATLAVLLLPALLFAAMAPRPAAKVARADPSSYAVQTVAANLDRPASLAILPDGRALVAERAGSLLMIAGGAVTPLDTTGLPPVLREGGGQLMAVLPDPAFAQNGLLYLTMGYGRLGANGTRLIRARLDGVRMTDVRILFDATLKSSPANNGGALAFLPDGTLVLSVGDGHRREDAQRLGKHHGKLVRLNRDGRVPADNPFVNRRGAAPQVYSLGHRNPQGLAFDAATSTLLMTDHGARGGDEINAVRAGGNHGWPIVTRGIDYSFARVSPFADLDGFVKPAWDWTPSIAPSDLAVYDGALFPKWRGDLLVPTLKGRALRRMQREGGRIVGEELLLAELGERLRDVKVAPDGSIYVLTDGERAKLLRLYPARTSG